MRDELFVLVALTATICILGLIDLMGADDYSEAVRQHQVYCDMVQDFIESDGERGWPDYQGTYGKYCVER